MLAEALSTHLPTSTLSVCTLPLPPMLCRLAGDRTWRPDNFQNKLEVFIELNERIMQFNRQQTRRTSRPTDLEPTFSTVEGYEHATTTTEGLSDRETCSQLSLIIGSATGEKTDLTDSYILMKKWPALLAKRPSNTSWHSTATSQSSPGQ